MIKNKELLLNGVLKAYTSREKKFLVRNHDQKKYKLFGLRNFQLLRRKKFKNE